ncbi:hypothetical protein [Adhaeribacter rhizoryzae]|uniref:hypothetical protein n=1 Tax=Adhaeribacter rhizoryzae TaxID=2607907 RepID=UPI00167FE1A9|nr:hypothetical protein [Adhaeribacter rhizoryzae]
MNLIFLFSLLIVAGMVINLKYIAEAVRKLLVPQRQLVPQTAPVGNSIEKK